MVGGYIVGYIALFIRKNLKVPHWAEDVYKRQSKWSDWMKRRTKLLLGIGISLLIVVFGGLGFAGNYFYTLAIDAHSDKSIVFGNEKEDPEAVQASKASYEEMLARDTDVYKRQLPDRL